MRHDELAAWLRLTLTRGVGNDAARRLLAAFGLPQAVFEQDVAALEQVVSKAQARALHEIPEGWQALLETTATWLAAPNAPARRIVTLGDAHYPSALLAMADPPLMLYMTGRDLQEHDRRLAMVGSRSPSAQGRENAQAFACDLARQGVCIVSGLALGIDGAAHAGALAGWTASTQPATIAVVGTGLDRVYPRQHRDLAHQIADQGVLISEYPLGTPPLASNFPKRNRIIAGLSEGTLVVEAALASGSLVTARLAVEQGKEVFAIPGSIHSPQSKGCHALIRQGAKLVESTQDILEELRGWAVPAPRPASTAAGPASTTADPLLALLGFEPASFDSLQARSGLPTPELQIRLLELELENQVARLPGGLFQRCVPT